MQTELVIAVITSVATLCGVIIQNRRANRDMISKLDMERAVFQAHVEEQIGVLSKKMDKHNNYIERIYKLETEQAVHETRISSLENKTEEIERRLRNE